MNPESERLQTVSRQDMTQESATLDQMATASLNKLGFIEKGSGEHQSNQVWSKDGISPTITAVNSKEPLKVVDGKKK